PLHQVPPRCRGVVTGGYPSSVGRAPAPRAPRRGWSWPADARCYALGHPAAHESPVRVGPCAGPREIWRHHVRRTVAQQLREGAATRRWPAPAHRHHSQPPDDDRPRHGRRRLDRDRQRRAAGGPAAARADGPARRARRRGGQGVRHRLAPGRVLRLHRRPGERRPPARRRRLVPRLDAAGAHRGAAAGRAGRVHARQLRAGPGRVPRLRRPRRADGAGRAHRRPGLRPAVRVAARAGAVGHAGADPVHRPAAVRQGVAPGVGPAGAAAQRPVAVPAHRPGQPPPPAPHAGLPATQLTAAARGTIVDVDLVTPSYRAASRLACALPGPLVEAVAPALGSLAALRDTDRRRMVERHQRRVDPSLSGRALAARVRAVYRSYARYYGESFRLPSVSAEELDARLTYEGYEHIVAAREAGVGPMLVLPHLGSWEWCAYWLTRVAGVPVTAVVERLEPPALFEWFVRFRESIGMHIVPLGPQAGRELV